MAIDVGAPAPTVAETGVGRPYRVRTRSMLSGRDRFVYVVLAVIWVAVNANFWVWWLRPEHIEAAWMYWPFTVALAYTGTLLTTAYLYFVGHMRRPVPMLPQENLRVALITPCVPGHEGVKVIGRQLEALARVRYPHDSWVLDEGNDPRVRELAARHGVRYFTRAGVAEYNQAGPPYKAKTKAGNVNSWLDAYGDAYDIFVQFDIDHLPREGYLDRVLGYFRDPRVAWVQAPSIYGNLDNWVARGAAEQELVLQGPLQQGFFGLSETPFIIGSHTTYRTAAVREIQGFQPTRAEDHLDSLVLAAHGYRGVFVPEVIAVGNGPETFDTYIQQQFAWAMSLMQVLLGYAPRYVGRLHLKQAFQFLFAESWYPLSSSALLLMSLMPLLALLTHQQPTNVALVSFLARWLPVGVLGTLVWVWTRPWRMPPGVGLTWRGVVLFIARWPIVSWAFLNVVLRVSHSYMITPKGSTPDRRERVADRRTDMRERDSALPERRRPGPDRRRRQRRVLPREAVGPVSTLRSRSLYLFAAWAMGAGVLWFLTVDASGLTGTSQTDYQRVQGFTLLVVWGMLFLLAVYAVNVIAGVATLWRQSRRLGRVARDYGLAIPVLVLTVSFWALLVNESAVRVDEAANVHLWPLPAMLPVRYGVSPPVASSATPAAVLAPSTATPQPEVVAPLADLPETPMVVGAYDPSDALAGSGLALQHWFVPQNQPSAMTEALEAARQQHTVPLVTVEPFPTDPQRADVLNDVVEGRHDEELRQLARAVADAKPQLVLLRWGHEMDLTGLYPWSTNDAAAYRAAYRHVVSIFEEEGADNVRWVWSPSGNTTAQEYYPGDDVVDYVGMTVLGDAHWDRIAGATSAQTFLDLLTPKYRLLAGYGKPMVIAELGVSGTPAYQQAWLNDAAGALPRFPLIRLLSYQNAENAPNNRMPSQPDWRVSPAVFSEFRHALEGAYATS